MKTDLRKMAGQYGPMVSSIARRMIQNRTIAEEAAQEAWCEIIKSLDSFNGNSEPSTWIYTIARRTISRYSQKENTVSMKELKIFRDLPEIEYPDHDTDQQEWVKKCCDWCMTALNQCLNNDARLIFIFRMNINLTYKQISEIMEMKEDNIRQIASRSFSKISRFLKDTCPLCNPGGACKCRINKHVPSVKTDQEYTATVRIIRLVDLYQRLDRKLPGKNYWEKFLA